MQYAMPGSADALFTFNNRYENYIGGEWVAPLEGGYFDNISPVTGEAFCEVARSTPADLHKALDAAHGAADAWGKTSAVERATANLSGWSRSNPSTMSMSSSATSRAPPVPWYDAGT